MHHVQATLLFPPWAVATSATWKLRLTGWWAGDRESFLQSKGRHVKDKGVCTASNIHSGKQDWPRFGTCWHDFLPHALRKRPWLQKWSTRIGAHWATGFAIPSEPHTESPEQLPNLSHLRGREKGRARSAPVNRRHKKPRAQRQSSPLTCQAFDQALCLLIREEDKTWTTPWRSPEGLSVCAVSTSTGFATSAREIVSQNTDFARLSVGLGETKRP